MRKGYRTLTNCRCMVITDKFISTPNKRIASLVLQITRGICRLRQQYLLDVKITLHFRGYAFSNPHSTFQFSMQCFLLQHSNTEGQMLCHHTLAMVWQQRCTFDFHFSLMQKGSNHQLLFSEDCVACSPWDRWYKISLPTLFNRSCFPWTDFAVDRIKLYRPLAEHLRHQISCSCVTQLIGGGVWHNLTPHPLTCHHHSRFQSLEKIAYVSLTGSKILLYFDLETEDASFLFIAESATNAKLLLSESNQFFLIKISSSLGVKSP